MSTTTFTVTFACDNAAFEGECRTSETARVLHHVANLVEVGAINGPVYDTDSNPIGSYGLEEVEDEPK